MPKSQTLSLTLSVRAVGRARARDGVHRLARERARARARTFAQLGHARLLVNVRERARARNDLDHEITHGNRLESIAGHSDLERDADLRARGARGGARAKVSERRARGARPPTTLQPFGGVMIMLLLCVTTR